MLPGAHTYPGEHAPLGADSAVLLQNSPAVHASGADCEDGQKVPSEQLPVGALRPSVAQ